MLPPPARQETADHEVRGGVRPERRSRPHANAPIAPTRSHNRNSSRLSATAAVPAEGRSPASVARLRIVGPLRPKGLEWNRSGRSTAGNCRAAQRKHATSASSSQVALDIHGLWVSLLGWRHRARHTRRELHRHQLRKAKAQTKIEVNTRAGSVRA